MKVLHFIHGLNMGGAETLVKNYMVNFKNKELDVVLLCVNHEKDSPYEDELARNGVKVLYVQDYILFNQRKNVLTKAINHFYRFVIIKRIIKEQSPDIIHTHLPINRFIKYARPRHDVKLFHTVHSEPKALWPTTDKKMQREFKATKWLIRHYDFRFIVLHRTMKKEIGRMFGVDNSIILNNGIDVDSVKNTNDAELIRKGIGVPNDAFVLGHVGRFLRVKNHDFIVDVFLDVAKKNNKAFLLLIGDGPDKSKIVGKLNDAGMSGRYLILNNRSDVPDLLNIMDVFIFPSLYEGIPLSLIEAQIAKKPCFVSDRVNKHAEISNLVTRLPLEQGAEKWSDIIVSYKKPKIIEVNEDDWNIKNETRKLEQIYLGVLAENSINNNNSKE